MKRQDRLRLAGMVLAILACGAFAAAQQTRPHETRPAKSRPATTQPAETQRLIERIVRRAKGSAAAAVRLLSAAESLADAPAAQVAVCQAAYDRGIMEPEGYGTAIEALDILDRIDSKRAALWAEKRTKVYRLRYNRSSGADRTRHGKTLAARLLKLADERLAANEAKDAVNLYREALIIANRLRLDDRGQISEKLREAGRRVQIQHLMDRLKAKLAGDPSDQATRSSLIRLCLVDMASPAEAVKYLSDDCDQTLRRCLPLAAKPVKELEDTECLELAVWYRALSAEAAAKAGKIKMLERARAYLERYIQVHTAKDTDLLKARLLLSQVEEAITKLTGVRLPKGAVLVLTFERNTLITRSGRKYIRDLSGKGNDGRLYGGVLVAGRAGFAMKLDTRTSIDLGNPQELQITGDQTICMWINPAELTARQNPINKAYGGEGTWTLEMNGTINYYYGSAGRNSSPYSSYSMSKALKVGQWAHVAVVRDLKSRKVTWYRDGVAVSSGDARNRPAPSKSSLLVGRGYCRGFRGMLDELAVFNRALSAEDIKAIYECGKRGRPLAG